MISSKHSSIPMTVTQTRFYTRQRVRCEPSLRMACWDLTSWTSTHHFCNVYDRSHHALFYSLDDLCLTHLLLCSNTDGLSLSRHKFRSHCHNDRPTFRNSLTGPRIYRTPPARCYCLAYNRSNLETKVDWLFHLLIKRWTQTTWNWRFCITYHCNFGSCAQGSFFSSRS